MVVLGAHRQTTVRPSQTRVAPCCTTRSCGGSDGEGPQAAAGEGRGRAPCQGARTGASPGRKRRPAGTRGHAEINIWSLFHLGRLAHFDEKKDAGYSGQPRQRLMHGPDKRVSSLHSSATSPTQAPPPPRSADPQGTREPGPARVRPPPRARPCTHPRGRVRRAARVSRDRISSQSWTAPSRDAAASGTPATAFRAA